MKRAAALVAVRSASAASIPAAAIALFSLLSCTSRGRLVELQPLVLTSPTSVSFGETPVLFPVRRTLLLTDGGQVPLHLSNARIVADAASAFSTAGVPSQINAGGTFELALLFRPPAHGSYTAKLLFDTDDPASPTVTVPLEGTGTITSALEARPSPIDFGRVGEGQSAAREVTIKSVGLADLYLGAVGFSPETPDAFGVVGSVKAPLTLPVGQSITFAVRFSPMPGFSLGRPALRLESSDPVHPILDVPILADVNRAPVAVALGRLGNDAPHAGPIDAPVGAVVGLDALSSRDPDGDVPLKFAWSIAQRPQGSAATIGSASAGQTSILIDVPGSYSVLLQATDATGLASVTPARLDIRGLPPEQLLVELVWDKLPPDLDLHFLEDGRERGSDGDCSWTNPSPQWTSGSPEQNPRYLGDKLAGYGPEQVAWKIPAEGRYRIDVVYKDDHGQRDPSTTAHVRVYAFGQIIAELSHLFARKGEAWTAGFVEWPQARVVVTP